MWGEESPSQFSRIHIWVQVDIWTVYKFLILYCVMLCSHRCDRNEVRVSLTDSHKAIFCSLLTIWLYVSMCLSWQNKKGAIIREEKGFEFGQGLAGSTPGLRMENREQTPLTSLVELIEGQEYKTVTRNWGWQLSLKLNMSNMWHCQRKFITKQKQ